MARTVRDQNLETRSARGRLKPSPKPFYRTIDTGLQAHSLLAWVLVRRTVCSGGISAVLEEATAEARTALALDERDAWAHMTQGQVLLRMRRHGEAERALRRALELNPNFALAHAFLGLPLAHQGRTAKPLRALSTRCD